MRFRKLVTAMRNPLVRRGVKTVSHPMAHWSVTSELTLPVDGAVLPPKPPKLESSLRVQRKKVELLEFTCQSARMLEDVWSYGAAHEVRLGKYGAAAEIAEASRLFSNFPRQKNFSLINPPPSPPPPYTPS